MSLKVYIASIDGLCRSTQWHVLLDTLTDVHTLLPLHSHEALHTWQNQNSIAHIKTRPGHTYRIHYFLLFSNINAQLCC